MYRGSATGLVTTASQEALLDQGGAEAEEGDELGASLAAGDVDGDGYVDLLAGIPGEDIGTGIDKADAGAALLVRGGEASLSQATAAWLHTDQSGVPGAAEAADRLGSAVALADFTGDGLADLGIGAEGENGTDGTVIALTSGPTGPMATSGLYYGPATLGTATGTRVGRVLAH
ncbi:FG-GAP repeat protein [Streptomyces viridiviolaceus]